MNSIKLLKLQKSSDNEIYKYVFTSESTSGTFETASFFTYSLDLHDVCVSSMAGCLLACKFCATTQKLNPFDRILEASEMYQQIIIAINDRKKLYGSSTKLRIGFMGNGEPFANIEKIKETITLIEADSNIKVRNYIISTIGKSPQKISILNSLVDQMGILIKLQYSLISLDDRIRHFLVPHGIPLDIMLPYLDQYAITNKVPVRYNMPLILDVNDTPDHLERVAKFFTQKPELRRLKLSAYNVFSGSPYNPCPDEMIYDVADYLAKLGVQCDIFFGNRSDTIFASCGQLRDSS